IDTQLSPFFPPLPSLPLPLSSSPFTFAPVSPRGSWLTRSSSQHQRGYHNTKPYHPTAAVLPELANMPLGDALSSEPIGIAERNVEAAEIRKESIAAAKERASVGARPGTAEAVAANERGLQVAPTEEELSTLRRVPNSIPAKLLSIGFIELCERFSYYGCS